MSDNERETSLYEVFASDPKNQAGLKVAADALDEEMKAERFFNRVYDILVRDGGAIERYRQSFIHHHLDESIPDHYKEWRFQGHLGFGGKYRVLTNTVDFYPEDSTPKRVALAASINKMLRISKLEIEREQTEEQAEAMERLKHPKGERSEP